MNLQRESCLLPAYPVASQMCICDHCSTVLAKLPLGTNRISKEVTIRPLATVSTSIVPFNFGSSGFRVTNRGGAEGASFDEAQDARL